MVRFLLLALVAACGTVPTPVVAHPPPAVAPITIDGGATGDLAVTRIAHASVLLELANTRILTDPWFTDSSQYHHGEPLGIALAALPHLDAVIISHDHYDHFDIDAFAAYPDKHVPLIVAPGMAATARDAGFLDVRELAPWQSTQIGPLTITATPAEHGVTENTYVLSGAGRTVFFGADSCLIPAFADVARHFPSVDLALLPINGLRAFGSQKVMTAEQAATLAATLHAKVAVPIHYRFHGGWFTELFLSYDGSPDRFIRAAARSSPSTITRILLPGQRLVLTDSEK